MSIKLRALDSEVLYSKRALGIKCRMSTAARTHSIYNVANSGFNNSALKVWVSKGMNAYEKCLVNFLQYKQTLEEMCVLCICVLSSLPQFKN